MLPWSVIGLQYCVRFCHTTVSALKVKVLVAQSYPTFATPWTVACQAPLSMEFSRQEYWSGLPYPCPGDLPDSGIECWSPALQAGSLPSMPSFAYIYLLPLEPPSYHRSSQSTKLSSLCYIQLLPANSLFYTRQCVYVDATLSICPTLSFPIFLKKSILISILTFQLFCFERILMLLQDLQIATLINKNLSVNIVLIHIKYKNLPSM